jgi:hypothetical protein
MTRIRNVWPRNQVAHLWANKSQDSARDPNGNFYFDGRALFSYGSHFVIAAHVNLGADDAAVLWNARAYSPTTSKHQLIAERALSSWQSRHRLYVDGISQEDLYGGNGTWMLSLARRCANDAGSQYGAAAECVRASGKRDGFARAGADYARTAHALAACVARGDGDAAGNSAADRRAARAILAMLAKLPKYPEDKAQQRQVSAAAAALLARDFFRQTLVDRARAANESADKAREYATAGQYRRADQTAIHADGMAALARDTAKTYQFRAPKLPNMTRFRADIASHVIAEARAELAHFAREELESAERLARQAARYGAERSAREVLDDAINAAGRRLAGVKSAIESAESYATAGHARNAVQVYGRAIALLRDALAVIPASHPAWHNVGDYAAARIALDAATARVEALRACYAAADAAALAAWRSAEPGAAPPSDCDGDDSPRLRVSRDGKAIETSWGAIVPASVAPMLWRLVQRARASGEPLDVPGFKQRVRVGSFELNEVDGDGGIVVGCHRIAWPELEYIAQRMGYITEGATA